VLFNVGKIYWSKAILGHESIFTDDLVAAFERYINGDWGSVSATDEVMNDVALTNGHETRGRYISTMGVPFYIVTNAGGTRVVLEEDVVRRAYA